MATVYVDFTPSVLAQFQFQATFDGQAYRITVTWNLSAQRYYINIFTLQGDRIVSIAMVGSPLDKNISLTAGYFATKLVWRVQNSQFEVIDP